jgi:hypothetical protein
MASTVGRAAEGRVYELGTFCIITVLLFLLTKISLRSTDDVATQRMSQQRQQMTIIIRWR